MTEAKRGLLVRDTARALLETRRLVPILVVSVPLVLAQARYSHGRLAVPLGVLICLAFVLVAPLSWRALFPEEERDGHRIVRLLAYAFIGVAVVGSLGVAVPELFHMGQTFLGAPASLGVSLALFLVGGWGLGRDIGLEASLRRERARAAALAREAERSHLLALRAHLDPHFLFNTLNAIAEWCREDGETAERAICNSPRCCEPSSKVYASPPGRSRASSISSAAYFRCISSAIPERSPSSGTSRGRSRTSPCLHSSCSPWRRTRSSTAPPRGSEGEIAVHAHAADGELTLTIENPGTYAGPRPGGEGLPVVQQRLKLAYGGKAQLSLSARGARTRAEVRVPSSGPAPGVIV